MIEKYGFSSWDNFKKKKIKAMYEEDIKDKLSELHYTSRRNYFNAIIIYLMAISKDTDKDPLIKEYMEIGVKNDEALIKMATIIQRVVNNSSEDGGLGITEDEKDALLAEMEKIQFKKED